MVVTTQDVVAMARGTTAFVLREKDGDGKQLCVRDVLQDVKTQQAEDKKTETEEASSNQKQRITALALLTLTEEDEAIGDCKTILLVLLNERTLMLYGVYLEQDTMTVQRTREMPRTAKCMTVAHVEVKGVRRHVVLIGEKTGEVVALPLPDIDHELKTLLGHTTSMITDVAMNHDHTLLLTADRDEKLRISNFPQTMLVQSYGLGHTKSLTKVCSSTKTSDLAVTTSLDNSIKLWKLSTGECCDSQVLVADENDANESELRSISLSVDPQRDIVAVVVRRKLRLFAIADCKLVPLEIVDASSLTTSPSSHVAFTEDGLLVLTSRSAPYIQLFQATPATDSMTLMPCAISDDGAVARLRQLSSSIDIPDEEEITNDEVEDGLVKKKIKLTEDAK